MVSIRRKLCFRKREVLPCLYPRPRRYSCGLAIERNWRRWSANRLWLNGRLGGPASSYCVPTGWPTTRSSDASTRPWTGLFVGDGATRNTVWRAYTISRAPADRRLFPPLQQPQIVPLATQVPVAQGPPLTQGSMTDLVRAAVEQTIVASISPATIWRRLEQAAIKPHRWHYWLNRTEPPFAVKRQELVGLYLQALARYRRGEILLCVDEKTSIQALERKHPTIQGQAGSLAKIEQEYIRHGTRCLTAAFEVAPGQVWGMLTPNRPAEVFAEFVRQVCDRYAEAPSLHLVVDNLSTHYHLLTCPLIAALCDCDPGPLKTGAQRKQFLRDPAKQVVFHFTPTHASWLNQIEIGFSTLTRKVLRRGDFAPLEDLEKKILAFIGYHDLHLAKPYPWTYTGKPLAAEAKVG
jgi:hypothetical protein